MATLNYIQEHKQSPSAMRGVIEYCLQKQKTDDPESGQRLIGGIHCSGETAYDEFMLTKQVFGKTGGVNFYQYTQSFDSRDTISSADAHALALEFAERAWPGHEVLVCTHCDTDNPHSHFVINSVGWEDGRKLRQMPAGFQKLRDLNDELCLAHGYTVITAKPKQVQGMSAREYRAAARGASWKFQLMIVIDDCMRRARSRKEYEEELRRRGYAVRWTPDRKYITYTTPTGMKCRDNKLHEEKYLKEHMEYEFRIREELFFAGAERTEPAAGRAGTEPVTDASHERGLAGADGRGGEDHGMGTGGMEGRPAGTGTDEWTGSGRPGGHERSADAGAAGDADPGTAGAPGDVETGWEEERETLIAAYFGGGPVGVHKEADAGDPNRAGDLGRAVGSAVGLLHRLEDLQNAPPVKDATTMRRPKTDHKRRKKELEKRRALGHKDNDHEDEQGYGGMKAPW